MSAPAFVTGSKARTVAGFANSITPNMPIGYAAGDLLVIVCSSGGPTNYSGAPSGWTTVKLNQVYVDEISAGYMRMSIFVKIAATSSDAAPTINLAANSTNRCVAFAYHNVDIAVPVDTVAGVVAADVAASATPAVGSITCATGIASTIIDVAGDVENTGGADGSSGNITAGPSGTTLRVQDYYNGQPDSIAVADSANNGSQTTAGGNWTRTGHLRSSAVIRFALRGASSPTSAPAPFIASSTTLYALTRLSNLNVADPFIAATTAVHAPTLTRVEPAPYIASTTTVYTQGYVFDLANPFIVSGTTTHAPTLRSSGIGTIYGQSASVGV